MRERVGGARLAWVRGSLVDYVTDESSSAYVSELWASGC